MSNENFYRDRTVVEVMQVTTSALSAQAPDFELLQEYCSISIKSSTRSNPLTQIPTFHP
jgi:hypothetical protein